MDQRNLLGLMALGDAFGSLGAIGGGNPGPQRALPFAIQMGQEQEKRQRAMDALRQSGQLQGNPALAALAGEYPDMVSQEILRAQFQRPETTEWERLTQGMSPEEIARARQIRLGLAPDADTALRVGASNAPKPATFRMASPEEAQQYGGPGQIDTATGRFYPLKSGDGMTVFGPDGQPIMTTGNPANIKPFTEAQAKDNVYVTRARGALEAFEPVANTMANLADRAANLDPTGLVRGRVQSDEFQIAQNAGNEFLQAILRKDTGAAITAQEQELYGQTYLPQPGDNELVMEEKRRARMRALAAIEAGLSPSQMIAQERGIRAGKGDISAPRPYQNMSDDELKRALGLQ